MTTSMTGKAPHNITTKSDLQGRSTAELLNIYNGITGNNTKKFASRAKAEEQTWKAVQSVPKPPAPVVISKVTPEKKKRGMRFRFAPADPKEFRLAKEGSARSKAYHLMNRPEGATLEEIAKETGWNTIRMLYEGIRLIHFALGYGMWHEVNDYGVMRICLVHDQKTYAALVTASKVAA